MKKHVIVQSYDKTWADDFVAIRDELNDALKDLALRIEHVGSTSVEGLSAKPIIDIDVVIQDRADLPKVIKALQEIGYSHEGDQGISGREAFKYEGKEHLRKHHLYVCALDANARPPNRAPPTSACPMTWRRTRSSSVMNSAARSSKSVPSGPDSSRPETASPFSPR